MLEDIGLFKNIGIAGVVLGALNPDGTVDVPHTRMWVFDPAFIIICPYNRSDDRLAEAALPMQGT